MIREIKKEAEYQKNRNAEEEMKNRNKLSSFIMEKSENAEKAGHKYSPKNYYDDLKDIRDREHEVGFNLGLSSYMIKMQNIVYDNIGEGYYKWEDLEKAREDFKNNFPGLYYSRSEVERELESITWRDVVSDMVDWSSILYKRGFLFVLILYLIRMFQRKGILGTFLADKKKFMLAVLVWPVFITKYPFNVAREIRVEAELRRMGKIFRKLSNADKELIRRVANSAKYREWLSAFRAANKQRFQHALLFTIAITISINALGPLVVSAEASFARDGPAVMQSVISGDETEENSDNYSNDLSEKWCLPEATARLSLFLTETLKKFAEGTYRRIFVKKVDHIPLSWLFSSRLLILN
ncbi:hypothetical protein BMS3Abin15_00113 [bacterium BMS3Abin15]|nr:hypothetical protein BMS3Abin15_00113 [bacterium BMS3Abin15]HDZ85188.1 hypothetical protein [Candidatus Moranbacteria bacterium]